jgi:hypothetical protein
MFFWVPFLLLGLLSFLLNFNGLYGQDAHEYLRMSQVYAARLAGEAHATHSMGDAEMAGGYPMLGALLQVFGLNAIWSLQLVSWGSAAACIWLFERLIRLSSPGSAYRSRLYFVVLLMGMSAVFVRAGCCSMSDGVGLLFVLATVYHAVLVLEKRQYSSLFWVFAFAGFAVTTRYASLILLSPVIGVLMFEVCRQSRRIYFFHVVMGALIGALPYGWIKYGLLSAVASHSLVSMWSVAYFFLRTLETPSGLVHHFLPNILFVLSPLAHPAFCLPISGLFFLWRKTDIYLRTQKTLMASIGLYLLFLAGLPHQNLRYLMPAYLLFLVLVFPAWDRMVSYGFYFFKKTTWSVLAVVAFCQLSGIVWQLRPIWSRHKAEQEMVAILRKQLHAGDILFGFDYDVALRNYMPELQHYSLWEQHYKRFPSGSYLIFNAPLLEKQWSGMAPMQNWNELNEHYTLTKISDLPSGWNLFLIE